MSIKRTLAAVIFLAAMTAAAEDPKAKAAREELEKQLHQMVGKQPTRVRVEFLSLDDPNFQIEEATFELDGRRLGGPSLSQLSQDGTHLIWNGDVTPGKHTVKVQLVISNGASVVLSDEGGYKWTLRGERSADVNAGIEVHVQVTAKRDAKQKDIAKRFNLATTAVPVMIAQLDDGTMPDAMPRPVIAVADAGVTEPPVVVAAVDDKKQKAAEAAEAKKQKAAEAAEAKRLAAEAKKEKAAAALEAKKAAAEARKAKAAEALEAKRAAAEEKKRLAQEAADEKKRLAQAALDAKNPPPVVAVVDAGAPVAVAVAEVDAGAAEEIDAGAPVAIAVAAVDAGTPAPIAAAPEIEKEGPPWLWIGIAGGVAALIFLIVVARRRSRPPTIDD
ncbi:MAG: hypothetical protein Q8L48_41970 [Archangium sp.]|nr:hypothetical protein [Archangium sp.]